MGCLTNGDLFDKLVIHASPISGIAATYRSPRMPDLIARTEAWIEVQADEISSRNRQALQPQDEGFILESFESTLDQRCVREEVRKVLHRVVYVPALTALLCLEAGLKPRQTALQKQSSLGQHFVAHFLDTQRAESSWKGLGQMHAHRALQHSGALFDREPAAKTLVAWSAGWLDALCFQRSHGRSDEDHSERPVAVALTPVFVDHDRGPHCERQSLLACLWMLQKHSEQKKETGPFVIDPLASVWNPELN